MYCHCSILDRKIFNLLILLIMCHKYAIKETHLSFDLYTKYCYQMINDRPVKHIFFTIVLFFFFFLPKYTKHKVFNPPQKAGRKPWHTFCCQCSFTYLTPRKKWSFLLRISSANVTKSAVSRRFAHIHWRNP